MRLLPQRLQVHKPPSFLRQAPREKKTFHVLWLIQLFAEPEKPADDKSSPAVGGQTDGAPEALGGSQLHEPEYAVDVKLSDLQADPNNPLYSVKRFEDLGL